MKAKDIVAKHFGIKTDESKLAMALLLRKYRRGLTKKDRYESKTTDQKTTEI